VEKRKLGKTDMNVSALGFGGSEIGYQRTSSSAVRKLLNNALDAGLNAIDTAGCYESSEELIGKAVGQRRKDYYLFTKCGHERGWGEPDWRPASLERTITRSLKRLKTDYVDLIQLHSCAEEYLRRSEVIEALERACGRGLARYIGYSGDGQAALYAVTSGAFDTLQTSVNIVDQGVLDLALPEAVKRNIGVIAKRPLANMAWHNGNRPPSDPYAHAYWERLQQLDYDFWPQDMKESVALALRFTLTVPGVHTAIVGTAKPGRFSENAAAIAAGPLPGELLARIRSRWQQVAARGWVGQT
jgi:aryl-alcohol dehydrogenase-like predicted oxidoreductase